MNNPDFQVLMLPLLECLKDGEVRSMQSVQTALAKHVELSDEPLKSLWPDEGSFVAAAQVALQHLLNADLVVEEEERGAGVRITSFGKMVLGKRLNELTLDYLRRLPG